MTRFSWRNAMTMGAVFGVLAVVSSGAAFLTSNSSAFVGTAHAGSHCTEYAGDVSSDPCAGDFGSLCDCEYNTSSEALRDDNSIDMAASRFWVLSYTDLSGRTSSGTGTFGSQGNAGDYTHAQCIDDDSSVSGMCWTDWHD